MLKFLILKYVSLGLASARSVLFAGFLGPARFGEFGTLVLAQQFLSYAALGAREGLSVRLAQAVGNPERALEISSSALLWAWLVGAVIIALDVAAVLFFRFGTVEWLWIGLIAAMSITNEMLINIARDRDQIVKVALLDLVFNFMPFCAAILLRSQLTVRIALQSMVIGLAINVLLYLNGTRVFSFARVGLRTARSILIVGIPMAILSVTITSQTAIFVFAANSMRLGATVGLIVFANSLSSIILFGLNAVAWAATSRSMKRLDATNSAEGDESRTERLTVFFRFGVIGAVLVLPFMKIVFWHVLTAYAGSEVYAVYLCLIQAFGLLFYRELNFFAVKARSIVIAAGYGIILLLVASTAVLLPTIGLVALMQCAIVLLWAFSLSCVVYAWSLGYRGRDRVVQVGYLTFPVAFGFAYWILGPYGGLGTGVTALGISIGLHRKDLHRMFQDWWAV